MGFEAISRRASARLGTFALNFASRWTNVVAASRSTAGLKADDLAAFVGGSVVDSVDLWLDLLKPAFGPLVPVLLIEAKAKTVPGGSQAGSAVLEDAVPLGTNLTATKLVFVGDPDVATQPTPAPLPVAAPVVQGALREEVTVALAVPANSTPPAPGIYEGLVLRGTVVVARITARILP